MRETPWTAPPAGATGCPNAYDCRDSFDSPSHIYSEQFRHLSPERQAEWWSTQSDKAVYDRVPVGMILASTDKIEAIKAAVLEAGGWFYDNSTVTMPL